MENYEFEDEYYDRLDDELEDEPCDKYDDEYNFQNNSINCKNDSLKNQTKKQTTDLVNYNNFNDYNKFIDFYSNKGYQVTFRRTQEIEKNGTKKCNLDIIFTRQPKKIEKVIKEYDSRLLNGATLMPVLKCYTTGLIFKDKHFYTDYEVVPCPYKQNYERTVTYYSDGTIDYSDWREI